MDKLGLIDQSRRMPGGRRLIAGYLAGSASIALAWFLSAGWPEYIDGRTNSSVPLGLIVVLGVAGVLACLISVLVIILKSRQLKELAWVRRWPLLLLCMSGLFIAIVTRATTSGHEDWNLLGFVEWLRTNLRAPEIQAWARQPRFGQLGNTDGAVLKPEWCEQLRTLRVQHVQFQAKGTVLSIIWHSELKHREIRVAITEDADPRCHGYSHFPAMPDVWVMVPMSRT